MASNELLAPSGDEVQFPVIRDSGILVTVAPKFELEHYIANYQGPTRMERLIHIGVSCEPLRLEALHLAQQEAIQAKNVRKYIAITNLLAAGAQATKDEEWIERTQQQVTAETNRLEQELKGYKNNLIKESIRMGNEDLGNYYFNIGHLDNAFKAFNRMRDQCTTPKHICDMSLRIILTATVQENWLTVQQSIRKINDLALKKDERAKVEPLIGPIDGLANLCSGKYQAAAESFLTSQPEYQTMEPVLSKPHISFQREVMSPSDVAVYGALTSLATFTREQLQTQVLENAAFRTFLELEPHLRRAITAFVSSKYTVTLSTLASYKADYLLDIHLGKHVEPLYAAIRRRSIVAYVGPYSAVKLSTLCTAFSSPSTEEMIDELADLIEEGYLKNFRIDVEAGTLIAVKVDERRNAYMQAMRMADEVEHDLRLRLFRLNCIQHGFIDRTPAGAAGASSSSTQAKSQPKGQRAGA